MSNPFASAQSTDASSSVIQQSYPPPPPWYVETATQEDANRRLPPPLPERTYSCFGWPRTAVQNEKTGLAALPQLDSETKLFSNVDDLKGEFRRLFKDLIEAILKFIDHLSQTGYLGAGHAASSVRTIMKIYKNLQDILVMLRYWEAHEEVVLHFERQLKSRRKLIDQLLSCLSPDAGSLEQEQNKEQEEEQMTDIIMSDLMADLPGTGVLRDTSDADCLEMKDDVGCNALNPKLEGCDASHNTSHTPGAACSDTEILPGE